MKLEQRFSQGLQVLAAFPQSKTMDEVSDSQTQGGNVKNDPQYAYRRDLDRGVAAYDQTRRFITSLLYELPFGKGKQWLNTGNLVNAILGGWQANTIITLSDGLPFTVSCYCADRAQTGNNRNNERMNIVGSPNPSGFTKTITQQFDTSGFKTPSLGTPGTVGRNTLRGPDHHAPYLSLFNNSHT